MKKWIIFLSILAVLTLLGYWAYRYYAPKVIANALVSEEGMSAMPEKVQRKVEALKTGVDNNIEKLPELMKELDVDFEDIEVMIDRADPDQFFDALDELKLQDWQTTDEVFDIGMKHISIEGYDLEKFRSSFNEYASIPKIQRMMEVVEQNEFITTMSVPVAKETAKRILRSKKEEILEKLNQ